LKKGADLTVEEGAADLTVEEGGGPVAAVVDDSWTGYGGDAERIGEGV
jgi:hypothetical protein